VTIRVFTDVTDATRQDVIDGILADGGSFSEVREADGSITITAQFPEIEAPPLSPPADTLKQALRMAVRVNEIGSDTPYKLYFAAKGVSGASFGFTQGDLAAGQPVVKETFRQVLAAAGVADNQITSRLSVHVISNPLDPDETRQVNAALDSPTGRALVDAMDERIFADICRGLDVCVAAAAGNGCTIEARAQIYMLLWINMTGPPTILRDWLGGQAVQMTKSVPALASGAVVTANDMERYLQATEFFSENPQNLPHFRQSVAAGAALLGDEATAGNLALARPQTPTTAAGGAVPTGAIRISAASGIDLKATAAVQQLVAIVAEATRSLPDGFRVIVTSTLRPGSTVAGTGSLSHHAKGDAIDIQIFDPQGRPIPNKGNDDTHLYQLLAIAAFHANQRMFPSRAGQLAWGGNFTTGPADGPRDLMHFDYGGDRGRFGTLAKEAASAAATA